MKTSTSFTSETSPTLKLTEAERIAISKDPRSSTLIALDYNIAPSYVAKLRLRYTKRIIAQMKPDWIEPYLSDGNLIPVVVKSNHPRFTEGKRFDWGFVKSALRDGYEVVIKP